MYDLIVIGGGPAGLTAALYARRANKTVLVIEKGSFGGQITYSPKVENIPGFTEITGNEFGEKMVEQVLAQEAEVELQKVARQIAIIWEMTKQNAPHEEIKAAADILEQTAQNMAAEAIQTAAMARKLLDYLESVKGFEE